MDYKVSMPINCNTLENYDREITVRQLKEAGADRVFLCPPGDARFWWKYDENMALLKKNLDYLKSQGFEVGVWVWTFQYESGNFTYMKAPGGKVSSTSVCPTDRPYQKVMGDFVEAVGSMGFDLIMFDDDFRYTFIDCGMACCCDNHLRIISDELGEEVNCEIMESHLFHGGKNKYRDAFIKANGKALGDFAVEMRRRLDKVNPKVRMGFCSCISSWDIDGIHPDDLAKKLAGNTRPFYRLIGAPYWVSNRNWGNRLGDVIELERMEAQRRKDNETEIFSEGDTYPRPRFRTPAAYLEGFDTALRAAGCMDGILKYAFSYAAHPLEETGYLSRHIESKKLYEDISDMFENKKSTGIRVYDKAAKYSGITIPEYYDGKHDIQEIAFNHSARLATACSLPTVFEGDGYAGIALGEDIKEVPEENLSKGLVIDLAACEILMEKGIDTGIKSIGEKFSPSTEIYSGNNNHVSLCFGTDCRKTEIDEKAIIESRFAGYDDECIGSFRYENSEGMRFLVLCFDAYGCPTGEGFYRQYERAAQIINAVPWLCGKELPATCQGNPELYIQAKENDDSTAIGLWNFFQDDIPEPVITLNFIPSSVKTIQCTAEISGNKVKLSRLEPYGFCAVELKK